MAYQQFFIQSGGNNANSGSTNSNTPIWSNTSSVVYTSNGASSTITATDSTMSAINIGDIINVGGTFLVIVTNVSNVGSAYTITFNATAGTFWGTNPGTTTYSSNGKVVDGGAWANITQGILSSGATLPQSTQINIKATIYTISSSLTLNTGATTTKPIWFRGYNTTVGDLEPGNVNFVAGNNASTGLGYPIIQTSISQTMALTSSFTLISGLWFTGGVSAAIQISGSNNLLYHCRCSGSGSPTNTPALQGGSAPVLSLIGCYFNSPWNGGPVCSVLGTNRGLFMTGCYIATISGNTAGISAGSNGLLIIDRCTISGAATNGIILGATESSGSGFSITNCTFNGSSSDAIKLQAVPTGGQQVGLIVANCTFCKSGGYDINNSSGTNTAAVSLINNLSYSPTSGHLNGFGDWQELNPLIDSSDPRTSTTDLHLISSSNGAGAAAPGQWENLTAGLTSTPDVGAWQRLAGNPIGNNFSGGFCN